MLSGAMHGWFKRVRAAPGAAAGAAGDAFQPEMSRDADTAALNRPQRPWPAPRLDVTDRLWGDGFIVPGGETETLRLAQPIGLSSASSVLLVGAGGGGAAGSLVRNMGAWVSAVESDPDLLQKAQALMKACQLGKKASIEAWDPGHPSFAPRRYHHCLALEPLQSGEQPEPILDGLSQALKLGGQLVMTELVADAPLPPADAAVSRWARLERRRLAAIPTVSGITRMLSRVGFDVRIVEDISDRHRHNAMIGWRVSVRDLQERPPAPRVAAQFVAEAEMWLLRIRLLRERRLKMVRWHAIARAPSRPAVE